MTGSAARPLVLLPALLALAVACSQAPPPSPAHPPAAIPAPAAAPPPSPGRPAAPPPAAATRPARPEAPVPFAAGEVLSYDVSWSSFVTAGTATLTVGNKKPSLGSTVYPIVAEGRSTALVSVFYPVYYKADTLVDAYDLLPQRGSIYGEEKGAKKTRTAVFDQARHRARFELRAETTTTRDLKVPAGVQDALSAFYWLRSYPLRTGAKLLVPIVFNGTVVNVRITVGAREQVSSRLGPLTAWHLTPVVDDEGELEARKMSLWISDDARRLPLRMQVELPLGSFDLVLKAAMR